MKSMLFILGYMVCNMINVQPAKQEATQIIYECGDKTLQAQTFNENSWITD